MPSTSEISRCITASGGHGMFPASVGSRFRHSPLNLNQQQVRLFRFSLADPPPQSSGPFALRHICLQIETFHAEARPTYLALSYEWGKEVNSWLCENGDVLSIRSNLWAFLSHLFYHVHDQWLWADQICIAQNDISEKNHQVQHMHEIFSGAEEVICWLGDVSKRIGHKGAITMMDWYYIRTSTYWNRLWVAQEVLLARTLKLVTANTLALMWERSCRADHGRINPRPVVTWRNDLLILFFEKVKRGHQLSLWEIAHATTDSKCSDPRDKVFGIMSLVHPDERIKVDYALSPQSVFDEYMKAYLYSYIMKNQPSLFDSLKYADCADHLRHMRIAILDKWSWEITEATIADYVKNLPPRSADTVLAPTEDLTKTKPAYWPEYDFDLRHAEFYDCQCLAAGFLAGTT